MEKQLVDNRKIMKINGITLTDKLFYFDKNEDQNYVSIMRPSISYWSDAYRRFRKNRVATTALILLVLLFLLAIFVPIFSSSKYYDQDFSLINKNPSFQHLFGTDDLGRDIFVRSWEGARVSLFIAFIATFLNGFIGILYGGISAYSGAKVDNIMMRFCEVITVVPKLLWIILLILVMRPGIWPVIIAIAATGWVGVARLFRGQVFQIREMEFVQASRILGGKSLWVLVKHLLPNAMSPIITSLAFSVPGAIFMEAFLSYIGLGLPMPMASLGVLISDGAARLLIFPYQLMFPAGILCLITLSFAVFGDGLRDALDPKLRS